MACHGRLVGSDLSYICFVGEGGGNRQLAIAREGEILIQVLIATSRKVPIVKIQSLEGKEMNVVVLPRLLVETRAKRIFLRLVLIDEQGKDGEHWHARCGGLTATTCLFISFADKKSNLSTYT